MSLARGPGDSKGNGQEEVKEIPCQCKAEGKSGIPVFNRVFMMFSVQIVSNNMEIIQNKHSQDPDTVFWRRNKIGSVL